MRRIAARGAKNKVNGEAFEQLSCPLDVSAESPRIESQMQSRTTSRMAERAPASQLGRAGNTKPIKSPAYFANLWAALDAPAASSRKASGERRP
jgi:hypothetical protein